MVKQIYYKKQLLGIIISNKFDKKGVNFFSNPDFSQQVAYMNHPTGKIIESHFHNPVSREVKITQEVLFIVKGKLRVDFYTDKQDYLESYILSAGDIIFLASGGHGFEVLENLKMFEVKQGPYSGDKDKTRFEAKVVKRIIK